MASAVTSPDTKLRRLIFDCISDLVRGLCWGDRKGDEELSTEILEKAFHDNVITVYEASDYFCECLIDELQLRK